jgi:hexosaminidase
MKYLFTSFIILVCATCTLAQQPLTVIPQPLSLRLENTAPFSLDARSRIVTDVSFLSEAGILAGYIRNVTGFSPRIVQEDGTVQGAAGGRTNHDIVLKKKADPALPMEGYALSIGENGISISASQPAGIFYGCMTLVQIIPLSSARVPNAAAIPQTVAPPKAAAASEQAVFTIPAVQITDQPRFGWRGLMLDCSRTFISIRYLKATIDRMSFYKLNVLHLHLTDDQGWRMQIKKYPLLQTKAAFFSEKYHEPDEFQGFYTQDQLRALVRYAGKRHVTLVPEIECPGHSTAALHAYPELSCKGYVPDVYPNNVQPIGIPDIFCAGKDSAYLFFKAVLEEVTDVFPSPYIHLGGDEVPRVLWQESPESQRKMKSLGLSTEAELQNYMMQEVSKPLARAGRRPVGWDEITEGGITKDWVVMSWRSSQYGAKAAGLGYDVVMCPTSHLYFDYDYRTTSTSKVYSFEPFPDGTSPEVQKHYLGIQANFWSHIDRTESRIDYQLFPRALALAERAWSEKTVTDFPDFHRRETAHQYWLNYFSIAYNASEK